MTDPAAPGRVSAYPPAGLDRRFYAFAIDRLIAWPVFGLGGLLGYRLFAADLGWVGLALVVAIVALVSLVAAVTLGVTGTSPGKAAMGLRVVSAAGGTPIGVGPALLRTLVLGVAALPTVGLGLLTLARTAVTDRGRRRRGWHDHLSHSVVVDVRPVQERVVAPVDDAPRQVVNLTALRLVPAPPPAQTSPVALSSGAPPGRTPGPLDPPLGSPPSDDVDRTVVRGASRPAAPPASWRVSFDTGESFLVEGLVLVGRLPEGRPGEPVRHLVPLPSEDMSVSKTHAQFQVGCDGVLVAVDCGSTNGSMLVRSGVASELPPGRPTTLLTGDLVRVGDRTVTVVRES